MATILPNGKTQFEDSNGRPLIGGQVYYYQPNTETKIDTWKDIDLTIPNTNPVVLDARGQAPIWGNTVYRQLVKDRNGLVVWDEIVSAAVSYADLDNGAAANSLKFDGVSLAQIFRFRLNRVVDSIAELRALPKGIYTRVFVAGYYVPHDGGEGWYQMDGDDITSVDNGGTVIVSNSGECWKLGAMGPLSVKQFGAPCNGITSDYPFLVKHFDWLSSIGGGTALVPDGVALTLTVNQTLSVPELCFLSGSRHAEVNELDVGTVLTQGARVVMDPTATIALSSSAGVTKLTVLKKGIRFNIASSERASFFQGTAVSIPDNTSGQRIEDCVVLGFDSAVATSNTAASVKRIHVKGLLHDCTNGVYIRNSYDLSSIVDVWGRPFCSFNAAIESNDAHLKRDGSNVYFDGVSAYNQVDRCFAFGWKNTYRATGDGNGAVTFTDCGADGPGGMADGSIGFDVHDSAYEVIISNPRASGKETGININTKDPNGKVTVVGGHLFECYSNCVVAGMGETFLTGVLMRNAGGQGTPTGNGVYAMNASTKTHISNCSINGMNIGVKSDSTGVKVFIDANTSIDRCTTRVNNPYLPGVVTASTLPIDGDSQFYHVAGTADISSIAYPERYVGKLLTLKFDAGTTVHNTGGNIKMAANYVSSPGSVLRLSSDGVNFYA